MSFAIYKIPHSKELKRPRFLPDENTLPIFLIPGILGFNDDFKSMAEHLSQLSQRKRDIYLFHDTRNQLLENSTPDFNEKVKLSFDEQASQIAEKIMAKLAESEYDEDDTIPVVIGAFSYGCPLAALAIKIIKEAKPNTSITLYVIDGSTPECAANYFQNKESDALNLNLIEVVNYACIKAGYVQLISNDDHLLNILKTLSLEEKLNALESTAKRLNSGNPQLDNHSHFHTYMTMIKNDLTELAKAGNVCEGEINANYIKLIATIKTQTNYNDELLGWPQEKTDKVLNNLAKVDHTKLLTDKYHLIANNLKAIAANVVIDINNSYLTALKSENDSSDDDVSEYDTSRIPDVSNSGITTPISFHKNHSALNGSGSAFNQFSPTDCNHLDPLQLTAKLHKEKFNKRFTFFNDDSIPQIRINDSSTNRYGTPSP